ncbi:hypothetical protein DFH08DRAFT_978488 [Mycena albidolilacea]|uniref:Uncharacterized protein n=1 Tax=Mycena albidolilacea TaxID=1033008 RepID=A0AAD7E820_9AGAR|nr:hypothetical protein DFH08DRAFT_978488 [Mycena albidolilacea]
MDCKDEQEQLHRLELNLNYEDLKLLQQNTTEFPRLQRLVILSPGARTPSALDLSSLRIRKSPIAVRVDSAVGVECAFELLHTVDQPQSPDTDFIHNPCGSIAPESPIFSSLCIARTRHNPLEFQRPLLIYSPPLSRHLHFLTLPRLRRLELDLSLHLTPTLLAFIARSLCTLEHLVFRFTKGEPVFRAIPALNSLTLEVEEHMVDLANLLVADPALLPYLTTLHISAAPHEFDHFTLLRLLRRRCSGKAHLIAQ